MFECILMNDCVFQFDIRALSESLKQQEAKTLTNTKPVIAEAPKSVGSGDNQDAEGDDSDLDIDNL